MNCITIIQPWASLIAQGYKTLEIRSWQTKYRGLLAIHAGKTIDMYTIYAIGHNKDFDVRHVYKGNEHLLETGKIIAICELIDIWPYENKTQFAVDEQEHQIPWEWYDPNKHKYKWVLRNATELSQPIVFKGSQGIYNLSKEIVNKLTF